MLDMDIIAHVAAALGPLASPIGNFLVFDFWTPHPPINFVHGSDKKCLNLSKPVAAALGPEIVLT